MLTHHFYSRSLAKNNYTGTGNFNLASIGISGTKLHEQLGHCTCHKFFYVYKFKDSIYISNTISLILQYCKNCLYIFQLTQQHHDINTTLNFIVHYIMISIVHLSCHYLFFVNSVTFHHFNQNFPQFATALYPCDCINLF